MSNLRSVRSVRSVGSILSVLFLSGLGFAGERPLAEQAYVGLFCRDDPATGGMLVGWVMPGPLKGKTFTSPFLNRGDIILAVNGKATGKKAFEALLDPLIEQHKLREPLDRLKKYLADTQAEDFGANSLSRVAAGFYRPTRLPELQKLITDPLGKVPGDPRAVSYTHLTLPTIYSV